MKTALFVAGLLAATLATQSALSDEKVPPAQSPDRLIWLSIHDGRVTLAHSEKQAASIRDFPGSFAIGCRKLQFEASADTKQNGIHLHCEHARFISRCGLTGTSDELVYDSVSGLLTMHGGEGHTVKLWYEGDGGIESQLTARQVQVHLKDSKVHIEGFQGTFRFDADAPHPVQPTAATALAPATEPMRSIFNSPTPADAFSNPPAPERAWKFTTPVKPRVYDSPPAYPPPPSDAVPPSLPTPPDYTAPQPYVPPPAPKAPEPAPLAAPTSE